MVLFTRCDQSGCLVRCAGLTRTPARVSDVSESVLFTPFWSILGLSDQKGSPAYGFLRSWNLRCGTRFAFCCPVRVVPKGYRRVIKRGFLCIPLAHFDAGSRAVSGLRAFFYHAGFVHSWPWISVGRSPFCGALFVGDNELTRLWVLG